MPTVKRSADSIGTTKSHDSIRSESYQRAVALIATPKENLEEFQLELKRLFPKDPNRFTKWLRQAFWEYVGIGGDPEQLINDVRNGLSKSDLMSHSNPKPL